MTGKPSFLRIGHPQWESGHTNLSLWGMAPLPTSAGQAGESRYRAKPVVIHTEARYRKYIFSLQNGQDGFNALRPWRFLEVSHPPLQQREIVNFTSPLLIGIYSFFILNVQGIWDNNKYLLSSTVSPCIWAKALAIRESQIHLCNAAAPVISFPHHRKRTQLEPEEKRCEGIGQTS